MKPGKCDLREEKFSKTLLQLSHTMEGGWEILKDWCPHHSVGQLDRAALERVPSVHMSFTDPQRQPSQPSQLSKPQNVTIVNCFSFKGVYVGWLL